MINLITFSIEFMERHLLAIAIMCPILLFLGILLDVNIHGKKINRENIADELKKFFDLSESKKIAIHSFKAFFNPLFALKELRDCFAKNTKK